MSLLMAGTCRSLEVTGRRLVFHSNLFKKSTLPAVQIIQNNNITTGSIQKAKSSVERRTNSISKGSGKLFEKLSPSMISNFNGFLRHMNTPDSRENPPEKILPSIMDFPMIMWPKIMNTLRNWFFTYFVIKPYFDSEFNLEEFDRGAREAISLISNKMCAGEFDDLEQLVERDALEQIKRSVSTFSVFQRELLRVAVEDIFFSFPYQIGIIIPDQEPATNPEEAKPQVRYVEITVAVHVLRGFNEMRKEENQEHFSFRDFIEDEKTKHDVMVCNYRFFRDFTQGCKDPSWIVNMVNHFLPADHARSR